MTSVLKILSVEGNDLKSQEAAKEIFALVHIAIIQLMGRSVGELKECVLLQYNILY